MDAQTKVGAKMQVFMPDIAKLTLGADAAEQDIKLGLARYFLENSSFEAIRGGERFVLVGNRGAGKTAIFKYLAQIQRTSGHFVIELSPEEYSYDILSSILRRESEGNWGKVPSYSMAWQYLIYSLVFKEIAKHVKGLAVGAKKQIYDFVRDHYSDSGISPLGLFVSYLKRLEGAKIGNIEVSVRKKELYQLYEMQEIRELFPSLEKVLDSMHFNIYVDELDKGWDNSEDAQYFVSGLLQAAQRINGLHRNMRVFVSVRQELFDNIPQIYDDAQKLRGVIESIRWSEEELLEFIALRLADPYKELSGKSPNEVWKIFFAETLDYRNANSFNYMVDRTQLRPREFLQFVRECLKQLKGQYQRIDYEIISKALQVHSENKLKDLASEYRFQYPGLLTVFDSFRGMKYNFEKDDLDLHLLSLCEGDIPVHNAPWVKQCQYMDLRRILWEIGFLKAWVIGGLKAGRKSGSGYLGQYELSSTNIDNIMRFQVHPAFWPYLSLKEK